MKSRSVIQLCALCAVLSFTFTGAKAQCGGVDRWAVKTITDGAQLDTNIRQSSIDKESSIDRPDGSWKSLPRQASEDYEIQVTGTLIEVGMEGDMDYHLVIKDGDATMIAEIPDPDCPLVASSPQAKLWRAARATVDAIAGHVTKVIKPLKHPARVAIVGFGFFDQADHGTGHSVNGRELHPVMSIFAAQ